MGPTIAGRIAGELGIGRILVPRDPGVFSAYGMLVTDVHQTRSFTKVTPLDQVGVEELDLVFHRLEEEALADLLREQFPRERLRAVRSAGVRYRGQSYEVSVPVGPLREQANIAELMHRFHDAHHRRYGHMAQNEAIEIVNFQVTGIGMIPKPVLHSYPKGEGGRPQSRETRPVYFDAANPVVTPVLHRSVFEPGHLIEGPAIVEEATSTTVIYPGQTAQVDEHLNLDIEVKAA